MMRRLALMTTPRGPETLGQVVRARRLELGLTQPQLAERVAALGDNRCDHSYISKLESGRIGLPKKARMDCLAAALGLRTGELLERSGWTGAEKVIISPLDTDYTLRLRLAREHTRRIAARHADVMARCKETHELLQEALEA